MLFKFYLRQNFMGIWPVSSPSVYPMLPTKWETDLILLHQGSDLGWITLQLCHRPCLLHWVANYSTALCFSFIVCPTMIVLPTSFEQAPHGIFTRRLIPTCSKAFCPICKWHAEGYACRLGGIITKGHCRPLKLTYFRCASIGETGCWVQYKEYIWNNYDIFRSSSRDLLFLLHPGAGMSPMVTLTQTKLNSSPHCSP